MCKILSIIFALMVMLCVVTVIIGKASELGQEKAPTIGSSPVSNEPTGCQRTDYEPDYSPREVSNVKSSDNKALVNMVGYLQFTELDSNSVQFSTINVTEIHWNQTDALYLELSLTDACAEIKFYIFDSDDGKYWLRRMELSYHRSEGDRLTCSAEFSESYPQGEHLKINLGFRFVYVVSCHFNWLSRQKLDLVIQNFEFELNGDPEKIKNGEFSTKTHSA